MRRNPWYVTLLVVLSWLSYLVYVLLPCHWHAYKPFYARGYLYIPFLFAFPGSAAFIINRQRVKIRTFVIFALMPTCWMMQMLNDIWFTRTTSLGEAVWHVRPDIVESRIRQGANVNAMHEGRTMIALDLERKEFLQSAHFCSQPIHISTEEIPPRRLKILRLLLENGADPNVPSGSFNFTPLHFSVYYNPLWFEEDLLVELKLLLDSGANPDTLDERGCSSFHYAIMDRNITVIKLLLKYGAAINGLSSEGLTPLDYALERNYIELIDFVRANGGKTSAELAGETTP